MQNEEEIIEEIEDDLNPQIPPKPPEPQWRKFRKPFVHSATILRQSAYIISVISESDFIQLGAKPLQYGMYFVEQHYTGQYDHETVALIGIPMIHVSGFFTPISETIEQLRQQPELAYIKDIDELSCNGACDILFKFKDFFDMTDTNFLLLLNIEPGGEGKYKRIYPHPRLTIPGGTMESKDCGDFFQCALREFHEETHIQLNNNYTLISQRKINKEVKRKKQKRNYQIFSHLPTTISSYKVESIYFALRIKL